MCDVSDLEAVSDWCIDFARRVPALDGLVHNAGLMPKERSVTREGHEVQLATHILGPHLMTERLLPLLRAARGAGIYMGVVSNKTGSYLRAEAKHLGWSGLFGRLVGAQDAARDKPDPAPIHMALDGSGITPGADVWFIGDAPIDAACGKAAGCTTIGVGPEPWADPKADHHVADCAALAALIAGLDAR